MLKYLNANLYQGREKDNAGHACQFDRYPTTATLCTRPLQHHYHITILPASEAFLRKKYFF
jgi:hypothetical protein